MSKSHMRLPIARPPRVLTKLNVPGEEILVTSNELAYLAAFHWPTRRFRVYPDRRTVMGAENVGMVAAGLPFTNGDRVIYLIGRAWASDPAGALPPVLLERYPSCPGAEVRGIQMLCLVRPSPRVG